MFEERLIWLLSVNVWCHLEWSGRTCRQVLNRWMQGMSRLKLGLSPFTGAYKLFSDMNMEFEVQWSEGLWRRLSPTAQLISPADAKTPKTIVKEKFKSHSPSNRIQKWSGHTAQPTSSYRGLVCVRATKIPSDWLFRLELAWEPIFGISEFPILPINPNHFGMFPHLFVLMHWHQFSWKIQMQKCKDCGWW